MTSSIAGVDRQGRTSHLTRLVDGRGFQTEVESCDLNILRQQKTSNEANPIIINCILHNNDLPVRDHSGGGKVRSLLIVALILFADERSE